MTQPSTASAARDWIEHDPDPATAAELEACSDEELADRFAHALTFGTAGLRGPIRGGPDGMNLAVVLRTTWAVAQVLKDRDHARLAGRGRRRRQARVGDVRPRGRRGACRRRLHGDVDVRRGPDARNRVRRAPSRRQRGHPDHRVAQSAVGQRLQGVLRQRNPDRAAHRPGHRGDGRQGPACRSDSEGRRFRRRAST